MSYLITIVTTVMNPLLLSWANLDIRNPAALRARPGYNKAHRLGADNGGYEDGAKTLSSASKPSAIEALPHGGSVRAPVRLLFTSTREPEQCRRKPTLSFLWSNA